MAPNIATAELDRNNHKKLVKFSAKIQRVKIFGNVRGRNVATAELNKNNHQNLVQFSMKIQRDKIFGNVRGRGELSIQLKAKSELKMADNT